MEPAYIGLMVGVILVSIYNSRLKRNRKKMNNINIESIKKINIVDKDFKVDINDNK